MLLLLGTTIATSFLDSLNPSAIAQQMIFHYMRACPDRAAAKAGER